MDGPQKNSVYNRDLLDNSDSFQNWAVMHVLQHFPYSDLQNLKENSCLNKNLSSNSLLAIGCFFIKRKLRDFVIIKFNSFMVLFKEKDCQ